MESLQLLGAVYAIVTLLFLKFFQLKMLEKEVAHIRRLIVGQCHAIGIHLNQLGVGLIHFLSTQGELVTSEDANLIIFWKHYI